MLWLTTLHSILSLEALRIANLQTIFVNSIFLYYIWRLDRLIVAFIRFSWLRKLALFMVPLQFCTQIYISFFEDYPDPQCMFHMLKSKYNKKKLLSVFLLCFVILIRPCLIVPSCKKKLNCIVFLKF